jgi:hypothetical protein
VHTLEPFYNWRHFYAVDEDVRSPFYGKIYSEFEFTNKPYNFLIHPQWDDFGSPGLFIKPKLRIREINGEFYVVISKAIEPMPSFFVQGNVKY